MRSLFRFFARNHVVLLFLALEIFSLILLFNFSNYQKVTFLNASNRVTASVYQSFNNVVNYFRLGGINEQLAAENARLRNQLDYFEQLPPAQVFADTTKRENKYWFKSARVINNSVNKQYNYLTLNKGRKDSILVDQGIIANGCVVGIVISVSNSYSMGMPLLNKRLPVSGKLKKSNYFGSVSWNGNDYRFVNLNEIPPHVELAQGDTVVTSGYSAYFPEGILIGTIESFELGKGESFYSIKVKLAVDFKSITYVDIIRNNDKAEIKQLELLTEDAEGMD